MKRSFEAVLTRCREQLEVAREHAGRLGLAGDFAPVVADAERTEFRVSVLGRFKQGKSSVLNAMLGEELLPANVLPCTATLVEVRRDERLSFHEVDGETVTRRTRRDFQASVGSAASRRDAKTSRWRVGLASESIPPGLVFVDTPGTDEDAGRHAIAVDELRRTDAALFVLSARQAGGLGELEDVQELCERVPIVLVLVNQMDLIAEGQRERVLAHVKSRLSSVNVRPERVLPFSALGTLLGDREAAKWLAGVRGSLSEVLLHNTAGARLAALQGTVAQFFQRLEPRLDAAVAVYEQALAEEQQALDDAERAAADLEAQLDLIDETCKRQGKAVSAEAAAVMKSLWPRVLKSLGKRRSYWHSDTSPLFSPRIFAEEIANCARTDLLERVERIVRVEIQPVINSGLHGMRAEIAPQVPGMLALMGRIAPSTPATKQFVDELFRDSLAAILGAIDAHTCTAREDATAAAVSDAVGVAVAQMLAVAVSGFVSGLVALPVLIAAVAGVVALSIFKGKEWLVDRARDQVADKMLDKLSQEDVRARVSVAVREATRDVFVQFGKAFRANVNMRLKAARKKRRLHADRTEQRGAELAAALDAAKSARRELRAVERVLVRERERLEQLRGVRGTAASA